VNTQILDDLKEGFRGYGGNEADIVFRFWYSHLVKFYFVVSGIQVIGARHTLGLVYLLESQINLIRFAAGLVDNVYIYRRTLSGRLVALTEKSQTGHVKKPTQA
jgi:hypothetical protein